MKSLTEEKKIFHLLVLPVHNYCCTFENILKLKKWNKEGEKTEDKTKNGRKNGKTEKTVYGMLPLNFFWGFAS